MHMTRHLTVILGRAVTELALSKWGRNLTSLLELFDWWVDELDRRKHQVYVESITSMRSVRVSQQLRLLRQRANTSRNRETEVVDANLLLFTLHIISRTTLAKHKILQ